MEMSLEFQFECKDKMVYLKRFTLNAAHLDWLIHTCTFCLPVSFCIVLLLVKIRLTVEFLHVYIYTLFCILCSLQVLLRIYTATMLFFNVDVYLVFRVR